MDESAAVAAAWAAVVSSFIGPAIGVVMANTFAKNESKRVAAAGLFRAIVEHSHQYRLAFQDMLYFRSQELAAYQNMQNVALNPQFYKPEHHTRATAKRDDMRQRLVEAESALHLVASTLHADILSLELLFDKESRECEKAIGELASAYEAAVEKRLSHDDSRKLVDDLVRRIVETIKPLHHSLRRSDPDADLY